MLITAEADRAYFFAYGVGISAAIAKPILRFAADFTFVYALAGR